MRVRRPRPLPDLDAAPSARFEVGLVLRRSQDIVRRRWLELLVVTVVLCWALPPLIWLVAHRNYRDWSHDLTPLGLDAAVGIVAGVTYQFGLATVMATALRGQDEPIFSGLSRVIRALPVLIPVWLLSDVDTAWRHWASWTGFPGAGSLGQRAEGILTAILTASALELFLVLVAAVTVGVFYPIVIDEGRGPFGAMTRAWRLMHGARWRFVSLFFLYVAMGFLISLPDVVATAVRAGHTVAAAVGWVTGGLSVAVASLWSVVVVASYIELRSVKEGPPHDQTAQAFA
jgi:hypothetical protein